MKLLLLVPAFALLGKGAQNTITVNTIPENTDPAVTATPPPAPVACILSGVPCPTGSTCTQTQTCGGLCIQSPQPPPPQSACTVGHRHGCSTGSTCTPTQTCGRGPCGGACITTKPAIATTSALPPTQACIVGANDCPGGQFCTQTQVCGGQCIATPTPPGPTPVACTIGARHGCPARSTCTPTMTCRQKGVCGGLCIGTPTATPTPHGHVD